MVKKKRILIRVKAHVNQRHIWVTYLLHGTPSYIKQSTRLELRPGYCLHKLLEFTLFNPKLGLKSQRPQDQSGRFYHPATSFLVSTEIYGQITGSDELEDPCVVNMDLMPA